VRIGASIEALILSRGAGRGSGPMIPLSRALLLSISQSQVIMALALWAMTTLVADHGSFAGLDGLPITFHGRGFYINIRLAWRRLC
jgi:hypothetical protein